MTAELALANVVIQVLLLVATAAAVILVRNRRFSRHCFIMRLVVMAEVLTVALVMAPSFSSYVRHWHGWTVLSSTIVTHMVLGVSALLLFIYANLGYLGVIKTPWSLLPVMRVTLVVWLATLVLGVYLYFIIWR